MIFHLKEDYSQEDLKKAYKKLVKKYHPDYNRDNPDWAHKKMTEINSAYELCQERLKTPEQLQPPEPERKSSHTTYNPFTTSQPHHENPFQKKRFTTSTLTGDFHKELNRITVRFCRATDRYYEYGLQNRFLRYEGNRKFRYRQCLKEWQNVISTLGELEGFCHTAYDTHVKTLYNNFIANYYRYVILDEGDIPRHPNINSHWNRMEEYLNMSLTDYLASHLTERFKRTIWQVSLAHCISHINYLQKRFPSLQEEKAFQIILNLAESYAEIREEEEKNRIRFFFP